PLFPYTTLFRSEEFRVARDADDRRVNLVERPSLARARVGRARARAETDDGHRLRRVLFRIKRGEDRAERPLSMVVRERLAGARGVCELPSVQGAPVAQPVCAARRLFDDAHPAEEVSL